jgi:hypothetical protein
MHPQELTAHQRDRARFVTAVHAAGKLKHADPQIRREMRVFASEYSRGPIVRGTSRERRPSSSGPRRRSAAATRDGPLPSSDDEPPLDLFDVALLGLGWERVA